MTAADPSVDHDPSPGHGRSPDDQDATVRAVLGVARRVAVIGASDDPSRDSNVVFARLLALGYDAVPVHPTAGAVHGVDARSTLADVDGPIDVVDVFRAPAHAAAVARQAVAAGARALWLQEGVRSPEARAIAEDAGLWYVEDRCLEVEAARFAATRPSPSQ